MEEKVQEYSQRVNGFVSSENAIWQAHKFLFHEREISLTAIMQREMNRRKTQFHSMIWLFEEEN